MPWRTRTCPLPESPWAGVRATRWSAPKSCPSAKTKGTVNKQGPPHTWIQGRLHAPSSAPPSNPAPLGTPQQISSKYDWPERETEAEMDRERESQRDRSRETEKGEEAAEREGDKSAACGQSPGHHTRRACGRAEGGRGGRGGGERSGWENLPQGRGMGGKGSPTLHPLKSQLAALRRGCRVTGDLGCNLSNSSSVNHKLLPISKPRLPCLENGEVPVPLPSQASCMRCSGQPCRH